MGTPPLARRLAAEAVGTAMLVAVVVGSGIATQQRSPNDTGLQLLQNSTATVLGFAPTAAPGFIAAQLLGALLGLGAVSVFHPPLQPTTSSSHTPTR
ncbi:hypothetical protein [Nocardia yamanashiensis]|uniref:hypothetical protein n=1 Tax=Nocardia yamanashiensis TaxID=209247 RepID=UPI002FCE47F7